MNNCNHGIELEVIEPEHIDIVFNDTESDDSEWLECDESIEFKVSQNLADTLNSIKTAKGE